MVDRYPYSDTFSSIRGAVQTACPMEIANATVEAAPAHFNPRCTAWLDGQREPICCRGRCIEAAGRESPNCRFHASERVTDVDGSDGLLGNDGNSELTFAHVSKDLRLLLENVHYIIIRQTDGTSVGLGVSASSGTTCAAVEWQRTPIFGKLASKTKPSSSQGDRGFCPRRFRKQPRWWRLSCRGAVDDKLDQHETGRCLPPIQAWVSYHTSGIALSPFSIA